MKYSVKRTLITTDAKLVQRCASFTTRDGKVVAASPKFTWLIGKSVESALAALDTGVKMKWVVTED